ncbi:MAG: hypothetical protein OEZ39_00025 [Gammaproteobacteria bacterium]|nr:hypothetical protein [Gammaproteobacteria bacterium]MDH5650233.1 hypothetical protein [Gammaproteobacteria bacterium]
MGYFILGESLFHKYPTRDYYFDLGSNISFLSGRYLKLKISEPLKFEIACPAEDHPGHYFSGTVPVVSPNFIELLQHASIDNFQLFPAVLTNSKINKEWSGFFAFNVIGLINAANKEHSKGAILMGGSDDEGVPALIDYEKLVIDPGKVKGAYMFRELSSPELLIFDDRIEDYIKKHRPPEGWGITVTKLESISSQ